MKVAIISDIHSNYYALKAVIQDIRNRGIENIYCAGDIIGYYTMPNETINLLKNEGVVSILGNHDFDILYKKFKDPSAANDPKVWNSENLSDESLEFLKSLPDTLEISLGEKKAFICHGSPNSRTEYLHEGSIEADMAIASISQDILICGHTHLPYWKTYGDKHIINSGSVGKPKNGAPHSTYVAITCEESVIVDIITVDYAFHETIKHVLQHNLPEKNTLSLIYGK